MLVEDGEVPRYRMLEAAVRSRWNGWPRPGRQRRFAPSCAGASRHAHGRQPNGEPNARMRRVAPDLDKRASAAAWATGPDGDRQIAVALAAATDMCGDAQGCNDEGDRLYRAVESWVDDSIPARLAGRYWFAVSNLRLMINLEQEAETALKAADCRRHRRSLLAVSRSASGAAHKQCSSGEYDRSAAGAGTKRPRTTDRPGPAGAVPPSAMASLFARTSQGGPTRRANTSMRRWNIIVAKAATPTSWNSPS